MTGAMRGKRKASYFENFEPLDAGGSPEAPVSLLDGLVNAKSLKDMPSLVDLSRIWSLESNGAADVSAFAQLFTAHPVIEPTRFKRSSGCSSQTVLASSDLEAYAACLTLSTPPAPPCLAGPQSTAMAAERASAVDAARSGLAPTPSLQPSSNVLRPGRLITQDSGTQSKPDATPPLVIQPLCLSSFDHELVDTYLNEQEEQKLEHQHQKRRMRNVSALGSCALNIMADGLLSARDGATGGTPAAAFPPPAAAAASPASPAAAAATVAAVTAVVVLEPPAVLKSCGSGVVAGGQTADFELCEKFYGSVMRLKDYAVRTNVNLLHPTGCDTPEDVAAGLRDHVRQVSKVCIDLFKPECPAVLAGLAKGPGATSGGAQGAQGQQQQQRTADEQRWRHVVAQLHLSDVQVSALLTARVRHLAKLTALHCERVEVAKAAHDLACGAAPGWDLSRSATAGGGGGLQLAHHGFLHGAHVTQGLQRAVSGLQDGLVRERDLVMKLYLELVYFILSPIQAANFIMAAFPNHIDVLAMANTLAGV